MKVLLRDKDDSGEYLDLKLVKIIILTMNNLEITRVCLDHIKKNTHYPEWQLIIVDNASKDGTIDYLEKLCERYPKKITVIKNSINVGFAKGCNIGARDIKDDYIVFLNNDVFVTPNWLQNMVLCLEKERDRAIVGAKLLFPETKRIQHAGVTFLPNGYPIHQYRNFRPDHPKVNVERSFPAVTAACLLIKAKIFNEIGGFDEQYILGNYEDVDLCLKAGKIGYKVIYCPTAVAYHYEKVTSHQIQDFFEKIVPLNRQKFLRKWFPEVRNQNILSRIFYLFIKRQFDRILRTLGVPRPVYDIFEKIKEKLWFLRFIF